MNGSSVCSSREQTVEMFHQQISRSVDTINTRPYFLFNHAPTQIHSLRDLLISQPDECFILIICKFNVNSCYCPAIGRDFEYGV